MLKRFYELALQQPNIGRSKVASKIHYETAVQGFVVSWFYVNRTAHVTLRDTSGHWLASEKIEKS